MTRGKRKKGINIQIGQIEREVRGRVERAGGVRYRDRGGDRPKYLSHTLCKKRKRDKNIDWIDREGGQREMESWGCEIEIEDRAIDGNTCLTHYVGSIGVACL